jgi:hypothetical protein
LFLELFLIFPHPSSHPLPPPLPTTTDQFDSRKKGDVLNDCAVTVDGIDFRIPQKREIAKGNAFASLKYNGKSALRYQRGVSILG